jgi:hypothetical protein
MKYYTYISNSKLNMLFPQIPSKFLDDISGELSVNIGVLKATLKDKGLTANRLSKLHVVDEYIRNSSNVGNITSKKPYINGTLKMHSVIVEKKMALFCWAGKDTSSGKKVNLLLSGSASHLIGMENLETMTSNSYTWQIIDDLERVQKTQNKIEKDPNFFMERVQKTNREDEYLGTVRMWANYNDGPSQKIEFLARSLVSANIDRDVIILASPIYVAMAD